jgi:ubiquinone/menaquinone biosynthesis C-methylase UbiE
MNIDYTDIAANYDTYRFYSDKEINKIIDFAGVSEGMRILDLGCGTGNISSRLQQLINVDVVGMDKSPSMLRMAAAKSLQVLRADASTGFLPFHDNIFDIVIAAYVIHQINNIATMFSECYRLLNNGRLVLLTSSHRQIETEHPVFKHFFPSAVEIDKARFPDIPVLHDFLVSAGFTEIRYDTLHISRTPLDEAYLRKVKGKYVSTYRLISQEEFERGVARLEEFIKSAPYQESIDWQGTLIRAEKTG